MLPSCNSKWTEHTPRTKLTLGQSFGLLFQQPGHRQGHHPSNTGDLCQLQHQGTEVASQQWPSQTPPAFKSSEQGKIPPGPCLRQLCSEQEEAGSSPAFSMLLPPGKAVNEEIWYTSLRCNFLKFFFLSSFFSSWLPWLWAQHNHCMISSSTIWKLWVRSSEIWR